MKDQLNPAQFTPPHRNTTLEVITLLSIIWSIFGILSSFMMPFFGKLIELIENSGVAMDAKSMDQFERMAEMAWPLFGLTMVTSILCLIGAIWMRKYKKSGLPIYLVGEWLPVIVTPLLIGFEGVLSTAVSILFPVIFTALYVSTKKDLIY